MKRQSSNSRPLAAAPLLHGIHRPSYARLHHESLEDRKMLAAYINEVYFDPPGSGGDSNFEYIELRTDNPNGNYSLANHYLLVVENEGPALGNNPGEVEMIFDLGTLSFGTNGFLTLRQKNTLPAVGTYTIAPNTGDYANTGSGNGWGSTGNGGSTLPVSDIGNDGVMENSGGTFMLIHNVSGAAPTLGMDLDTDNNGLDNPTGATGWSFVDRIGIHSETDDPVDGILYAMVNFGATATPPGNIPVGATYVNLGYEVEYFGRWGDSTGQTTNDWHVSNLTNDPLSGYVGGGPLDFRQSGDPHGLGNQTFVETSQGVPYGVDLTATLGATNFQNAAVVGRRIFYNNSIWDNPTFGFNNSSAIAPDKSAYIPSGFPTGTVTVGVQNVTSYTKGINGIMVDLAHPLGAITPADFQVKMSGQDLAADNTPSGWAAAPAFTVTAVPNTPVSGTTRYELVWPDGSIVDRYVQVLVEGADATGGFNFNTGLPTSDIFYFGNRVGDAFTNYPGFFNTDATDALEARGNQNPFVGITNPYDFDRDAVVNASDELAARFDQNFMAALVLSSPPAAPQAADDGGDAVASALAAPGAGDAGDAPSAALPVERIRDLVQTIRQHVPEGIASRVQARLAALEDAVEQFLDDDLIDALLARLRR
jgi:hypothetical protein